jgi:hypothetical protein
MVETGYSSYSLSFYFLRSEEWGKHAEKSTLDPISFIPETNEMGG